MEGRVQAKGGCVVVVVMFSFFQTASFLGICNTKRKQLSKLVLQYFFFRAPAYLIWHKY